MKKLIALIAALGVVTSMSLTSLAAVTVTAGKDDAITINATVTDTEGVYTLDENTTFKTNTSATDGNTQTTILAVSGYDGTAASITTNSIQYINQGTDKNYEFALKDALTSGTVTVLMGGDTMNAPATVATLTIATVEEGGEGAEKITVSYGDVNGDGEVGASDASLILQKGVNLIAGFTDQEGNALTTYTYTYVTPIE